VGFDRFVYQFFSQAIFNISRGIIDVIKHGGQERKGESEMLVHVYQSARCYAPGDCRLNNLKTSNLTQNFSFPENDFSFEIKAFV
jgi:hypothetical protein